MDKVKVAEELVKVAKELTAGGMSYNMFSKKLEKAYAECWKVQGNSPDGYRLSDEKLNKILRSQFGSDYKVVAEFLFEMEMYNDFVGDTVWS